MAAVRTAHSAARTSFRSHKLSSSGENNVERDIDGAKTGSAQEHLAAWRSMMHGSGASDNAGKGAPASYKGQAASPRSPFELDRSEVQLLMGKTLGAPDQMHGSGGSQVVPGAQVPLGLGNVNVHDMSHATAQPQSAAEAAASSQLGSLADAQSVQTSMGQASNPSSLQAQALSDEQASNPLAESDLEAALHQAFGSTEGGNDDPEAVNSAIITARSMAAAGADAASKRLTNNAEEAAHLPALPSSDMARSDSAGLAAEEGNDLDLFATLKVAKEEALSQTLKRGTGKTEEDSTDFMLPQPPTVTTSATIKAANDAGKPITDFLMSTLRAGAAAAALSAEFATTLKRTGNFSEADFAETIKASGIVLEHPTAGSTTLAGMPAINALAELRTQV